MGECPLCGRAARKAPDEPRVLTTTHGDVAWVERIRNCPHCRRAFFPQSQALAIDRTGQSPAVQKKLVYAGVHGASSLQASRDLAELAGLRVDPKQVEWTTKRIGQERLDQRQDQREAFRRQPLVAKDATADPQRPVPSVVKVSIAGGRLQIRERDEPPGSATSHWRESKVSSAPGFRWTPR